MTRIGADSARHTISFPGDPEVSVTLAWAAVTDVGHRRRANEDSLLVAPPVFAVADGMGGHASGDRASAAAVHRLAELAGRDSVGISHLAESLSLAAHDIDVIADGQPLGAGTTVTGALVELASSTPHFLVFNVGDSRVYCCVDDEFVQVTRDHSVVQELVDSGRLAPFEAEGHPDSNVVTRALGFHEEPRPDYWAVPIRPGMRLLLCSDGLTKEVQGDRIHLHLTAGLSAVETAETLLDAALSAGGRDNVTIVIVDVLEAVVPSEGSRSVAIANEDTAEVVW